MPARVTIPQQTQDSWADLRQQIMGNPNSVVNNTRDWVGLFMEGFNEAIWPRRVEDAAEQGSIGLGPGVITAIPKPFRSEWIERVKKYAPSFPKKATGAEILEQLEGRGVLPKGYREYYLPKEKAVKTIGLDAYKAGPHPDFNEVYGITDDLGNDVTHYIDAEFRDYFDDLPSAQRALDEFRNRHATVVQPVVSSTATNPIHNQLSRDQLIPYLEENWVNPRIDVRSNSGYDWFESLVDYESSHPIPDHLSKALINSSPRHPNTQTLLSDNADDYFELLVKPRRGLEIPVPEKLREGGHWNDPSVMAHVRGEVAGPRAIVQEIQGDWNRVKQLKNLYENQRPMFYSSSLSDQGVLDFAQALDPSWFKTAMEFHENPEQSIIHFTRQSMPEGWAVQTGAVNPLKGLPSEQAAIEKLQELSSALGTVPSLPPEFSKAWPEAGIKAALAYAARDPKIQRVSFVDDIIAAGLRHIDPDKTKAIYGLRTPQFLRKYVPGHGGEYKIEPGGKVINDLLSKKGHAWGPDFGRLHTAELGDWNSTFRKFLRGQQPLATVPFLADMFNDREQ